PPSLLGLSVLQHLQMSSSDQPPHVHIISEWTLVHQPQSLQISAGARPGETWTLTSR
ncbi:hypothetical protein EV363DRAFT_1178730, partial [Boletus edulis]